MKIHINIFVFLLLLFFMSCANARDNSMLEYFNRFVVTFSSGSVSKDDYISLVDYKIIPDMHSNYDVSPPEQYQGLNKRKDIFLNDINILFNGGDSRFFFLSFVKDKILSASGEDQNNPMVYIKKNTTYSFKIMKNQETNIVIFENILAMIPGSENSSEFSCFYDFKKVFDDSIKLTDVNCAG